MTDASTPPARLDPDDVARFDRIGAAWWDEKGPMGKLHEINPLRVRYVVDAVRQARRDGTEAAPLGGLTALDIGCGGGLLAEPLARLGASVTGIDPAPGNVAVAEAHAAEAGLAVSYRATTAETLEAEGRRFDLVVASEVVEHVPDRDAFMATVCALVAPGGVLVMSTLNRTAKAYLLAIVGGEYVLGWLPRGTHRWSQFVTPAELTAAARRGGLRPLGTEGLVFDLLRRDWRLSRDTDVNYFFAARRPAP